MTFPLFLDLDNLHGMALISDLPEPRLCLAPRATGMHITDQIPFFTPKGRPAPLPLAVKQFHWLAGKQGQGGSGQWCWLGSVGLRSLFMSKGYKSCTGKGETPLGRHSPVLADGQLHRHSAFRKQHLATSLVTEASQHKSLKGVFFLNFKRVSWPHPTSCRVQTPLPVSRAWALAQVCWDIPACSASVVSDYATLPQLYIPVLGKAAHQPCEHVALAGWKSPLFPSAVPYP